MAMYPFSLTKEEIDKLLHDFKAFQQNLGPAFNELCNERKRISMQRAHEPSTSEPTTAKIPFDIRIQAYSEDGLPLFILPISRPQTYSPAQVSSSTESNSDHGCGDSDTTTTSATSEENDTEFQPQAENKRRASKDCNSASPQPSKRRKRLFEVDRKDSVDTSRQARLPYSAQERVWLLSAWSANRGKRKYKTWNEIAKAFNKIFPPESGRALRTAAGLSTNYYRLLDASFEVENEGEKNE